MATELQKILGGTTRAGVEADLEIRELGLNEATTQLELIVEMMSGSSYLHFPSLERLDDYTAGYSGASLIGVEDDSFVSISGDTDLQTVIKSIDTAIAGIASGSNPIYISDNTANAFRIIEQTNSLDYFGVDTPNGTEVVWTGNTTSNPQVHLRGSGGMRINPGAPAVTLNANADDFSVESATSPGMSLAGANGGNAYLYFAKPADNDAGGMWYSFGGDTLYFRAGSTNVLYMTSTNIQSAKDHLFVEDAHFGDNDGVQFGGTLDSEDLKAYFSSSQSPNAFHMETNSPVLIGGASATVDSNMSGVGLVLDQGSGDDFILVFKSSDVNTGESYPDQDTYAFFRKHMPSYGGLEIAGISEGGYGAGIFFRGIIESTSSYGVFTWQANNGSGSLGDTEIGYDFKNSNSSLVRIPGGGGLLIAEQSNDAGDWAGFGNLWVKNDSPNKLMFTNDDGDEKELVGMTSDSFTFTATGMTTSPTCNAYYTIIGDVVVLKISSISGTSNAATFTLTGLPAAITPAIGIVDSGVHAALVTNNSTLSHSGGLEIGYDGSLVLEFNGSASGWTSSGTKGLSEVTVTYKLST